MLINYGYQQKADFLRVLVDTDHEGCKQTRRSTNGGLILLGGHLIKTWATTQTVIALSSGEAEYYGVTKGACEALGVSGLVEDLGGKRMQIELGTDSSAAKGIATRRGIGKGKHLETRTLWVQSQVERTSEDAKSFWRPQPSGHLHEVPHGDGLAEPREATPCEV